MEYTVKRKKPLRQTKASSPESHHHCVAQQPDAPFDQKAPFETVKERAYQFRAFLFLRNRSRRAPASIQGLFGSFRRNLPCGGRMPGNFPVPREKLGFPLRRSRFPDNSCIISHPNLRRGDSQRFGRGPLGSRGSQTSHYGSFLAICKYGWRKLGNFAVLEEKSGFAPWFALRFAVLGARVRNRMRSMQQAIRKTVASMGFTIIPGFSRSHEMWR